MTDYQVNLPKTGFPMKANLANREKDYLAFWQEINLYQKMLDKKSAKGKFILHDGPPYANGAIHLGHAVNKILKDMALKVKSMDGLATPYVPGWDCHGLPIELNVEKKIGRAGEKVTPDEFISKCQNYAKEQIAAQREAFIRLGVLGDWDNYYQTMAPSYEANIMRALGKIIAAGYVERGYKPVHWCIACGSALAEAEVEYIDKTSPAIDVRFALVNPESLVGKDVQQVSLPIWTTTPWTLPANEAVAVHPNFEYVLVKCGEAEDQEHFLIAKDLLESVMQRYGIKDYQVVAHYFGKDLAGHKLQHPFLDKQVPIIFGEHVTVDAGTGAVHTAPAHGADDFKIGLNYELPVINPVGPDGRFLADTPFFAGEKVFTANEKVIELLREKGNLIFSESITHSYPHCWRHKTPLIFRATEQWFISMDKKVAGQNLSLRERALLEIEKVNWMPKRGKESIRDMLQNRPDWCISRQRFWGTPMALFIDKETGALHPETPHLLEIIAQNVEREGLGFWHKLDAQTFLAEHVEDYAATDYEKVNDTLDVWFDSGVSHFCVLNARPELQFPADLYLEGQDQYRGWFQSSLLTALAIENAAPYRQVLTHGMTVDAAGRKMSKSLGNVIAPDKVIATKGADILRLWIASSYIYNELAISEEILQRTVDAYRMLRNTARFLLGNCFDFYPEKDLVGSKEMLALDRYAVRKMLKLQDALQQDFAKYGFHSVYSALQTYVSNELSSYYFSIIKDRLYTMPAQSKGRRSAQTALWHILEILVRLLAPILSFTAEEIWQEMRNIDGLREESVFLSEWYVNTTKINAEEFFDETDQIKDADWQIIESIRNEVNKELEKLRASGKIGSGLEAEVTIYADKEIYALLKKLNNEVLFIFITSSAEIKPLQERVAEAVTTEIAGLELFITPSTNKKCCRCWHRRPEVGKNAEHPDLCDRCLENVFGNGEERFYA